MSRAQIAVLPPPVDSAPARIQLGPARALNAPAPAPASAPSRPRRSEAAKTRNPLTPSWNTKSYDSPRVAHLSILAATLALTNPLATTSPGLHHLTLQSKGLDPFAGTHEFSHPGILQSPFALNALDNPATFKAKLSKDPDLPTVQESLTGPYAEEFWKAMDKEIRSLEGKGTWIVVERSSLPDGTTVVPGTWAQRIKRLPMGELSKFKSRWCCRGDLQPYEGEAYSPLVGWPTVRSSLLLAAAQGWKSRQVDFTLAFCQSPQPADKPLYMELPQYY